MLYSSHGLTLLKCLSHENIDDFLVHLTQFSRLLHAHFMTFSRFHAGITITMTLFITIIVQYPMQFSGPVLAILTDHTPYCTQS